jgi:hypothetical protein
MRIKLVFFLFFFVIFANSANANIYWLYEFYNISPNFNIFSLNDDEYQKCLKENLGEKDYKKAVEYKSSITQKMEGAADQCVEKLLISQSNPELQLCLENELTDQSYNNLITKQFSKSPGKNDFKAFYKCLSELKTNTIVASNEQYNESNSCPEGYKLVDNSCQSDGSTSEGLCPEGYKLVNNSCQSDGSKKQKKLDVSKKQEGKKLNIEDPNLKSCLQKSFSQKAYNEIFLQGLRPPDNNEKKEIEKCLKSIPKEKDTGSFAQGYNTPDFYYDIFDGGKKEDCVSNPQPIFTHEITDLSKIRRAERWGQVKSKSLKNHSYLFLKKKNKPIPVYAPVDSYLILQTRYRLQGLKEVHWRLIFQVGCEIVYRFDHVDTLSDKLLKHLGNIPVNEDQNSAPNVAINPPIKIKGGELIAYTQGIPQLGQWDFGLSDISKNNELPKRLKNFQNKPAGRQYKYSACPYDYYPADIKKKYLKKMKGKKCNPKEIEKNK